VGFLDRWRRGDKPAEDSDKALYVHLALDGGIFVIRGGSGEQLWIDRDGLEAELLRTQEQGGTLVYSREKGDEDPPPHIEETFKRIADFELPIMLLEQPHPEALVPPRERRTITRG
jgi:hypothetical protein